MGTLMSKVRKALEERTDVVILDEFATRIGSPQKYLKSALSHVLEYDPRFCFSWGNFVIAPKEGIYSIPFNQTEYVSEELRKTELLYRDLDRLVGSVLKTTRERPDKPRLDTSLEYHQTFPRFILHMSPIIQMCDFGTLKCSKTTTLGKVSISDKYAVLPKKGYKPNFAVSVNNSNGVKLSFTLQIYVWLNQELYQKQQKVMQQSGLWDAWLEDRTKRVRKVDRESIGSRLTELGGLLSSKLEDGSVDVCAFNQYFQEHPPKGDEKR